MKMVTKSKGYPWRASLTKKARCATCKFNKSINCSKGNEVQYPLYSKTHNCPDFEFKENPFDLYEDDFTRCEFIECAECSYNFKNRCSGKRWIPIKKIKGKCEFFHHKDLICKNAIPYSQYCNHLRNNYCRLLPHKRDVPKWQQHWSWNCPFAHTKGVEKSLSCYKPKKVAK